MKVRNIALVTSAPIALLVSMAFAQADPSAIMAELDADGSGSLSEAEASANEMIMSQWDELDADSSGDLSAEELASLAE